jgi:hypothetical protein
MSTKTTKPAIKDVIVLLNDGGWRLMGGKIARNAYREEYEECLPANVKPNMRNCFFKDSRRIYIASASLDESGGVVLHVYANHHSPTKVDPDECREICSGVLVEPQVDLFGCGSKDYYGPKDGTPKRIEIRAKFPETVQEKKRYGGGYKVVWQHIPALCFERC